MIFERAGAYVRRCKQYFLMGLGVATIALSAAGYVGVDLRSHSAMLAEQCWTTLKTVREFFVGLFQMT
jgi:hypothetical protein